MMLFQIVYASRVAPGVTGPEIAVMLGRAAERNRADAVSGFICYSPRYFLQALEGPRQCVNDTFGRIMADKRHAGIVVISARELTKRDFGQWAMGYMSGVESKRELYFRYGCGHEFEPMRLTSQSAIGLLLEAAGMHEKSEQAEKSKLVVDAPVPPGTVIMARDRRA